jgi:hypothetical protein
MARGIFPENARIREMPNSHKMEGLSPSDKSFIRAVYKQSLKPYARA